MWAVVVITVAAIAVAGVVSLGVVDAVSRPAAPTAASSSTAPAPSSAPTIAPISDSIGQKVNGCLAGAGITGGDLLQIRRQKDLSAGGAAEFLGGFLQVTEAADPGFRDGLKQVVDVATSGTAQKLLQTELSEGTPGYGDAEKHGVDLSEGAFHIEALTAHTITLDVAAATTTNGAYDKTDGGDYKFSGGTFTLTATSGGWVVSGASGSGNWLSAATKSGTKYSGGC